MQNRIATTIDRTNSTARNAGLEDIVEILRDRAARRHDIVVPATQMFSWNGDIHVKGSEPQITEEGVSTLDGVYKPTTVFDEGLSEKFSIPRAYLRRLREERVDLLDATLNHHIRGGINAQSINHEPDSRDFLLRTLRGSEPGTPGVARALLSSKYAVNDDFEILLTILKTIRDEGIRAEVKKADLTERRMYLRLEAPEITQMAPTLLAGYRSPYRAEGEESPVVSTGIRISNSEVGSGAYTLTHEVIVKACDNGLLQNASQLRAVHLGSRLEVGAINWSAETDRRNADLIASKTADAIRTFLSPDALAAAVARMEAKGREEVATVDGVRNVTKGCGFSEAQMDLILADFVRGGQMTVMGVANAITSASQRVTDADDAYAMDMAAGALLGV